MDTELGWKEAIVAVLSATKAPMRYTDIAEEILSRKLREVTATPPATVAATIAQSFKNEKEHSPFVRVSRGVYGLRDTQTETPAIAQEEQEEAEGAATDGIEACQFL
ncbi:MAG: winged helix-turn-helix domain-containing protein [Bryobacteraceae bacterium]